MHYTIIAAAARRTLSARLTLQHVHLEALLWRAGRLAGVDPRVGGMGVPDQQVAGGDVSLDGDHRDATARRVVRDDLAGSGHSISWRAEKRLRSARRDRHACAVYGTGEIYLTGA